MITLGFPGSLTMQETQESGLRSLGQEDLQGKEMATHSNIVGWEIPGTEKPDGLQSMESQKCRAQLSD